MNYFITLLIYQVRVGQRIQLMDRHTSFLTATVRTTENEDGLSFCSVTTDVEVSGGDVLAPATRTRAASVRNRPTTSGGVTVVDDANAAVVLDVVEPTVVVKVVFNVVGVAEIVVVLSNGITLESNTKQHEN